MTLTDEEVQTLQDLWSNRETVNWAVYDRLKDKILRGAKYTCPTCPACVSRDSQDATVAMDGS